MRVVQVNFGEHRYQHAEMVMFAIREARRQLGLSRAAFAERLNARHTRRRITAESIEGWELGRNVPPADAYMIALEEAGLHLEEQIDQWLKKVRSAIAPTLLCSISGLCDSLDRLVALTAPVSPWW